MSLQRLYFGLAVAVALSVSAGLAHAEGETTVRVAAASQEDTAAPEKPAATLPAEGASDVEKADKVAAAAGAATAAKPVVQEKKPATPTLKISIDLTSQRLTVKDRGKTIHTFKISSGRKKYATPTGSYRPQWMTKMHYSRKYDNAPMPHSIFFHKGYAIHATYATGMLGRPASHGCIRLSPGNAKKLYRLVGKHSRARTRISISGWPKFGAYKVANKKRTQRYSGRRPSTYRMRSTSMGYPSHVRRTWPGDSPRRLRYGYGY